MIVEIIQTVVLGTIILFYLWQRRIRKVEELKLAQIRAANPVGTSLFPANDDDEEEEEEEVEEEEEEEDDRSVGMQRIDYLRTEIYSLRRRRDALMVKFTSLDATNHDLVVLAPQLAILDDAIFERIQQLLLEAP